MKKKKIGGEPCARGKVKVKGMTIILHHRKVSSFKITEAEAQLLLAEDNIKEYPLEEGW